MLSCSCAALLSPAQRRWATSEQGGQAVGGGVVARLASQRGRSARPQLGAAPAVLFLAATPASFKLQSGVQRCGDIHDGDKKSASRLFICFVKSKTAGDE